MRERSVYLAGCASCITTTTMHKAADACVCVCVRRQHQMHESMVGTSWANNVTETQEPSLLRFFNTEIRMWRNGAASHAIAARHDLEL